MKNPIHQETPFFCCAALNGTEKILQKKPNLMFKKKKKNSQHRKLDKFAQKIIVESQSPCQETKEEEGGTRQRETEEK